MSYRRELAYAHVSMGTFLDWNGEPGPALATYSRAVPLLESLVQADPRNADARLLLAETYNSIGYVRAISKDPAGAMTDLRRSLALFQSIAASDPANARAILGLARLYESFGAARTAAGDAADAHGLVLEEPRRVPEAGGARPPGPSGGARARGGLGQAPRSSV